MFIFIVRTVDGSEIWRTSWDGQYPITYRVSYMSGGAGFLPSTVGLAPRGLREDGKHSAILIIAAGANIPAHQSHTSASSTPKHPWFRLEHQDQTKNGILDGDIPNRYPLYKVYMGLIIKGTIPRVPAFFLWKMERLPYFFGAKHEIFGSSWVHFLSWCWLNLMRNQPGFPWIRPNFTNSLK